MRYRSQLLAQRRRRERRQGTRARSGYPLQASIHAQERAVRSGSRPGSAGVQREVPIPRRLVEEAAHLVARYQQISVRLEKRVRWNPGAKAFSKASRGLCPRPRTGRLRRCEIKTRVPLQMPGNEVRRPRSRAGFHRSGTATHAGHATSSSLPRCCCTVPGCESRCQCHHTLLPSLSAS